MSADIAANVRHALNALLSKYQELVGRVEASEKTMEERERQHLQRIEERERQMLHTIEERERQLLQRMDERDARLRDELERRPVVISCGQARKMGFALETMRQQGVTCAEAKAAGYVEGLKAAGYSLQEVKAAGYSCKEAKAAGFMPRECKQAGFSFQDACSAGLSWSSNPDYWNNQLDSSPVNWEGQAF